MNNGYTKKEKLIPLRRDLKYEEEILKINEYYDSKEKGITKYMGTPRTIFEKDIQKGVYAYRNRWYAMAVKEFFGLLEKYPEEGILYYYIANSFSYMSDGTLENSCREYAINFFKKALEFSDYPEIWADYGNLLMCMKKNEEAVAVLEEGQKNHPEAAIIDLILSCAYRDDKKRQLARNQYHKKVKVNFNEDIREWETENQVLKIVMEDFV